jgi:AcrR family transcriptional regulator
MGAMTVATAQRSRSRGTRAQSRRVIVLAAGSTFVERGYEASSIEEIAHRAGLTRTALLYHFKSKEELLSAVVEPLLIALDELLAATPPVEQPTPSGRRDVIERLLEVLVRHRDAAEALVRFQSNLSALEIGAASGRYQAELALRLGGRAAETDPDMRLRIAAAIATVRGMLAGQRDIDLADADLRARLVELIDGLVGAEAAVC